MGNYNLEKAAYVLINDTRVANIVSVNVEYDRELVIENGQITKPNTIMHVTLKRQIFLNDPRSDGLNLRGLENFTLAIYTPTYITTYTNCQWLGYKETVGDDNVVLEELHVASLTMKMVWQQ